ncbi:S-formylglutathione hydrolase [Parvibaculum sedimenti]|uniref:S-formylglutathione hydrolase n=1 Tax=Parvibaculum sedimenti TaxID=2608632 RepID=A0A6N6VKB2_9HYPH|nr:S-formylglutathione hydrolase [Parvibaculum sedimenti]KAB7738951.1 S-formylglutathione hydrolase [Parvibaculum sedimenti]
MSIEFIESHRCFSGALHFCRHQSEATGTPMRFSAYVPDGEGPFPVVTFLSGLTCTEENFTVKAGAYRRASALNLVVIAPDTSPRGEGVANDPAYDLGQGAGFYVDATEAPWAPHFRMESYIAKDLQQVVAENFPVDMKRQGITGHSMGGHGALTLALKYPDLFRSVSAFAPIVSPTRCPWGEKAFNAYLGADRETWKAHDATLLIEAGAAKGHYETILVDQGGADNFLEAQLKPELLEEACAKVGQKLVLRMHPGHDHSYYFIQTFIDDHLAFHAATLLAA